jgi:hypothetical protein
MVVPAGATGLALSQAGEMTIAVTKRTQSRSRIFTA